VVFYFFLDAIGDNLGGMWEVCKSLTMGDVGIWEKREDG